MPIWSEAGRSNQRPGGAFMPLCAIRLGKFSILSIRHTETGCSKLGPSQNRALQRCSASLAAVTAVQLLHRWKLWLCKKLQKTHPVTQQIENLSNLLQSLLWCENLLMDDYGSWIAVCMAVANQNNIPMRVANNVASTSPAEWPSDLQGCCAVLCCSCVPAKCSNHDYCYKTIHRQSCTIMEKWPLPLSHLRHCAKQALTPW